MPLKQELGIVAGIAVAGAVIFGPLWWRPAVPCIAGDLAARAQARVPERLEHVYLDARKFRFGFGSAAIGGWEGLGDAVAVGGLAWVRTTHAASPNYFAAVSNRYFQSNGFVYLALEHGHEDVLRPDGATPFSKLWDVLATRHPEGVMFEGTVRLAPLRLIAIARPAIDGRAVLKNAAQYYTRPMESAPEAWAWVAGVAAARSALTRPDRAWLATLLSVRPDHAGQGAGLAHALWLRAAPDAARPPDRDAVRAVGRIVADQTTLMEGELRLYPLARAGDCREAARAVD